MHDFEKKYTKYKNKYILLKKQYAGGKTPHSKRKNNKRKHSIKDLRNNLSNIHMMARCFPYAFFKLTQKLNIDMQPKDISRLKNFCYNGTYVNQVKLLSDTYNLKTTLLLNNEEIMGYKKSLDESLKILGQSGSDISSIRNASDLIYEKVIQYFMTSTRPEHRFLIMIAPHHAILVHKITLEDGVVYFYYTDEVGENKKNTMHLAFEKYFVVVSKYNIL